jgi:uncharacterized membrane-anchored protein YhcB (DUF1043 family)
MTNGLIAFAGPGLVEWIIILIVFGVPVLLIVLFIRYLLRSSKERQKLRLELGKLADELEQVRKQAEEHKKDEPPTKSK